MKVEMFDLEEFYNPKYRSLDNGLGPIGVSIITAKQMVSRTNATMDESRKVVGSHFEVEGSILSDIFGFDKELFSGFGFNDGKHQELDEAHKKVLNELVTIKYMNNSTGNHILIYLPYHKTITSNQYEVLKWLGEYVEETFRKTRRPISIMVTDRKTSAKAFNSFDYNILPYLEEHIDDTFVQSVSDENIIAENELFKQKKL